MAIRQIKLENFTVFRKLDISFEEGLNIFVGENGTGKTHIMKVIYSFCQSSKPDVGFAEKLVKVFKPDDMKINRLVNRQKGSSTAMASVFYDNPQNKTMTSSVTISFSNHTKKWNATVTGEDTWEKIGKDSVSTYIPTKDILANAYQFEAAYDKGVVDFDETYKDIITTAKIDINKGPNSKNQKKYLDILRKITTGSVNVSREKFYLKPGNQSRLEFHLISEGWRKLALLWQLIKNGTLENGTVLFWDEPEANINPIAIKALVEILLELQKDGVQIFISTHDYIFAKYLEVKATKENNIAYYSLYKNESGDISCEKSNSFRYLNNNPILKTFDNLLDEVMEKDALND
jgi:AAA15 family ATPase/GTPase